MATPEINPHHKNFIRYERPRTPKEKVSSTLPDDSVVIIQGQGIQGQVRTLEALVKAGEEGVLAEELVQYYVDNGVAHRLALKRVKSDVFKLRLTLEESASHWEVLNKTPHRDIFKGRKAIYYLRRKNEPSTVPTHVKADSPATTLSEKSTDPAAKELPQIEVRSKRKTPEEIIAYSAAFKVLLYLLDGTLGDVATNSRIVLDNIMEENRDILDLHYISLDTLFNDNSLMRFNRFLSNAIISAAEEGFNPANKKSEDEIIDKIIKVCQQLKDKGSDLTSVIQETHRALGLKVPARYRNPNL